MATRLPGLEEVRYTSSDMDDAAVLMNQAATEDLLHMFGTVVVAGSEEVKWLEVVFPKSIEQIVACDALARHFGAEAAGFTGILRSGPISQS